MIKMDLNERNQNMRNFFNNKIDTYDDVHEQFLRTKNALADSLRESDMEILDLGAGTGLELIHLFEIKPNAHITAIDISEKMLEKLKERPFKDRVQIISGDFFEVDFGNNYDAVISTSALHHFNREDKIKLYKKIYDSLKEDGIFINSDKIASSTEEEQKLLEDYYKFKDVRPHCDTPLSLDSEEHILREVNYKEIEVKPVDKDNYRLIIARK